MSTNSIIPYLFRTEYSKIVAVLCKTFGLPHIQLAEDIVSEAFLKATETWGLKGVPDNPKAWLYQVAKNKAKDHFKREQIFSNKIIPEFKLQKPVQNAFEIDLSESNIEDSQLQMLFTVCNPIISKEAQITFALRVLCGFGIEEISKALLTNKAVINKRLLRTKEAFRKHKIDLAFPLKSEVFKRLNNVLSILYVLFNEGYYSSTSERTIQKELCIEAMRLLYMLLNTKTYNLPQTNALMALFCFQASRFEARMNKHGEPVLYHAQDQKKWDKELIGKGNYFLNYSKIGVEVTKYHLEAQIAFWHTRTDTDITEKWHRILQLYNQLIQIEYSPITALNRAYALAMSHGKEKALKDALKIKLENNHLYHTLLAELYDTIDKDKQLEHLQQALTLVKTENDKKIILQKIKETNNSQGFN